MAENQRETSRAQITQIARSRIRMSLRIDHGHSLADHVLCRVVIDHDRVHTVSFKPRDGFGRVGGTIQTNEERRPVVAYETHCPLARKYTRTGERGADRRQLSARSRRSAPTPCRWKGSLRLSRLVGELPDCAYRLRQPERGPGKLTLFSAALTESAVPQAGMHDLSSLERQAIIDALVTRPAVTRESPLWNWASTVAP